MRLKFLCKKKPSAAKLRSLFASKDQTVLAAALHSLRKANLAEGRGKASLDYALKDASVETGAWARHHLKNAAVQDSGSDRLEKQTIKALGFKPFASRQLLSSRKPGVPEFMLEKFKRHEGSFLETIAKNSLPRGEALDLIYAIHLLRVPPSLEEMRRIIKEKEAAMTEGRQTR